MCFGVWWRVTKFSLVKNGWFSIDDANTDDTKGVDLFSLKTLEARADSLIQKWGFHIILKLLAALLMELLNISILEAAAAAAEAADDSELPPTFGDGDI